MRKRKRNREADAEYRRWRRESDARAEYARALIDQRFIEFYGREGRLREYQLRRDDPRARDVYIRRLLEERLEALRAGGGGPTSVSSPA